MADVEALSDLLATSSVVAIGGDIGEGINVGAAMDSVTRIVEAAARNKTFDGNVHKFCIDGQAYVPIFSDVTAATVFCGAYVDLLSRIHAFRLFRIPGSLVKQALNNDDVLVVNPQNDNEAELSVENTREIQKRSCPECRIDSAEFLSVTLPIPGVTKEMRFAPKH